MKILANKISNWLKDYAETNSRKAFVVGVSGGIDSALVSTLCARTGIPTVCVILPCHSKADQTERGENHIVWLNSQFSNIIRERVDLTNTFDAFKLITPTPYISNLAFANTKSRLRMTALYQIATPLRGLVVGTGNKVEDFGVGFFTKYGDGGVDISPIADLTKTEVRAMAKELGINNEIVSAIPTDGLWEDTRTDEQQLGASYEELEWAMKRCENTPESGYENDVVGRQKEVLNIYIKWHNAGAHKLLPIPTFKR